MPRPLTSSRFREEMLRIMDRKHHWAWPLFSDGKATKNQMMAALGFSARMFEDIQLLPGARRYRAWLERSSNHRDWVVAAAVMTVFVEGSIKDRKELSEPSKPKSAEEIESIVQQHPLVRHYGLPTDAMDLIRAHQMVEAGHRHDAYHMVVNYAKSRAQQDTVLRDLNRSLRLWTAYRDEVAQACGIGKPDVAAL